MAIIATTGHRRQRHGRTHLALLVLAAAVLLCGSVARCSGVEIDAVTRPLPAVHAPDAQLQEGGADMSADEAAPPATEAAPKAAPEKPTVTPTPLVDTPLHNDRTTHISFSDDSSEETHCTRTGPCVECSGQEKTEAYCLPTGMRQEVTCLVMATATSNRTEAAAPAGATAAGTAAGGGAAAALPPGVRRSYIQQASCEGDGGGSGSFWAFQFLCVVGLASGMWLLRKRRRVVQSLHHRRMDRLVNS